MTTAAATPGPWSIEEDLLILGASTAHHIPQAGITIVYQEPIAQVKTNNADAVLIRAAPDMLAALEEIATSDQTSAAAAQIATAALARVRAL